ncbi:MAG: phosphate signaling complex protein PhoU [Proteobacteria bacterium]|nr:phosphate signaling complex protein PhoU [Pseudomonadota bacterium]
MLEEEKITNLKKELIEYTALVEGMIVKSVKGLQERDKKILLEVSEEDEAKANDLEIKLEEICTTIIAQHQPKGKSLRTLLMSLKINNDLERMADYAVKIVESSFFLIERTQVKPYIDLPKLAEITINMVKDSITSFVNEDVLLAQDVCKRDNRADNLSDQILSDLKEYMASDSATIERSLSLLRVAGSLERIADLSTNICEDVIYMVEGKVIKHHTTNT